MSVVATTRTWVRRLAAAAPDAWHSNRLFRWSAIGAGIALAVFVLRLADPPTPRSQAPATGQSVPDILGPTYGASAVGTPPVPPVSPAAPKIAPGRSLDGVTITPAPADRFGIVPPANR